MTAPLKPWERASMMPQPPNDIGNTMSSSGFAGSDGLLRGVSSGQNQPRPPPVPSRPSQQRATGYTGMPYGGGYGSSYGMYSPYGGTGSFGMGGMYGSSPYSPYALNRYNTYNQPGQNEFVRMAEENSRQAFQSIESIVQAFGSVSMMLESTFAAVYNSFRAVIGVADHFSRMRMHFAQIFSALAIIRTIKWLYRKLLVLLRLREAGVSEEVWASAASSTLGEIEASGGGKGKASWPVMLFFAVVVGGPWLIWRLLCSLTKSTESNNWANGEADHFVVVALYDFHGEGTEELSFRTGDRINVAPKELQPNVRGWLLASVDGKKTGLIPANYIRIVGKRQGRGKAQGQEAADSSLVLAQSWIDAPASQKQSENPKLESIQEDSLWDSGKKSKADSATVSANTPLINQTQNNYGLGENMETEEQISEKAACDILDDTSNGETTNHSCDRPK